jgi:hypothetical protein
MHLSSVTEDVSPGGRGGVAVCRVSGFQTKQVRNRTEQRFWHSATHVTQSSLSSVHCCRPILTRNGNVTSRRLEKPMKALSVRTSQHSRRQALRNFRSSLVLERCTRNCWRSPSGEEGIHRQGITNMSNRGVWLSSGTPKKVTILVELCSVSEKDTLIYNVFLKYNPNKVT